MKKKSQTRELGSRVVFAAFEVLKENGGELPGREVLGKVEQRVALDEWAKARLEKSGYVRWQSVLHFYSIDCVKAGLLIKKKGTWYLTKEGEDAMKLGADELLSAAQKAYRQWKKEKKAETTDDDSEDKEQAATIDEMEQVAIEGLKSFIKSKNPYQFQDLAAALLRGMGYYTPFVAPSGKDGGVDIIAYRDPLGTVSPRIKVQIKHRNQSTSAPEIRQLMGLLQKAGDVGIFISSGGFTADSKTAARSSHVHVELIDMPRFIELWQEFYHRLNDEDKALLPLIPIYFYSPSS